MMGVRKAAAQLFYEFDLGSHVPADHLLREIDRFLEMDGILPQRAFSKEQRRAGSIEPSFCAPRY
jgi:hypothetical protein